MATIHVNVSVYNAGVRVGFFILAIAGLQFLSILISEASQSVQATVADNNIVRELPWTSASLDNNLRPTTSNMITLAAASISDNGNNNTTPFLLPLPSSGSSDNNSSPSAAGRTSITSPSNNNVVNSHSPSHSRAVSQTNIVSSDDNHVENQHKTHNHDSNGDSKHQVISQGKKQFNAGDIPFP
jgi:hypothetical protein